MQHIIEIRQADLTEFKISRLNQFIENGRVDGQLLQRRQVTPCIVVGDIPATMRGIMGAQWQIASSTQYSRYKAVVGSVEMQINILVDEIGNRFIVVYTKRTDMPNTIGSIHIGYDATLTSVNQMFTVTKIKAEEWRYC